MHTTPAQRALIRTAILADPIASAYLSAQDNYSLKLWCNSAKAPAVLAWGALTPSAARTNSDWPGFDSLTAGKRDSWGHFLAEGQDMTLPKVRKWITDVWGPATAGSASAVLLQGGTDPATNAQVAIGGVPATVGTVTAIVRAFPGLLDDEDTGKIVNNVTG